MRSFSHSQIVIIYLLTASMMNIEMNYCIGDDILVGFAGSTADAMTLLERLEKKLGKQSHFCSDCSTLFYV